MCSSVDSDPAGRVPGCGACNCLNLLDAELLPVAVVVPAPNNDGFCVWLQWFRIPDMDSYEALSDYDRAYIAVHLCDAAMQNYAVGHP